MWFELVPEPNNRYDATAVALDLEDERAGYAGADVARHLHWRVRRLNLRGSACFVPGLVEEDDVWVVLPTFATLDPMVDIDEVLERIRAVYDSLPEATRSQIEADGFHIASRPVMKEWCRRRDRIPEAGLPARPNLEQIPPLVNRVLMQIRREATAERVALRRAEARAKAAADEEERRRVISAREQARAREDLEIQELLQRGFSVAHTSRTLSVSMDRARRVRDRAGIPAVGSGDAPRVARAREALALFDNGLSRGQIAEGFGVSIAVVKSLLALARFLDDPASYPDRHTLALQAQREGWTKSSVAEKSQVYRRAVSDARDLHAAGS